MLAVAPAESHSRTGLAVDAVPRKLFVNARNLQMVVGHSIPSRDVALRLLSSLPDISVGRVLAVGVGTGYIAAILGHMAKQVFAIERVSTLAQLAKRNMLALKLDNVTVHHGDGAAGLLSEAPFDLIVVCTPSITARDGLLAQLAPDGALYCLEGREFRHQELVCYQHDAQGVARRRPLGPLDFGRDSGDLLLELGMVDETVVREARALARKKGGRLVDEIRQLVQVDDLELYRALASQHNLPLGIVEQLLKDSQPALLNRFPRAFMDHNHFLPIRADDERLTIATSDPDVELDGIRRLYPGRSLDLVLVTPTDFRRLWYTLVLSHYDNQALQQTAPAEQAVESDLLGNGESDNQAHLIALFEALLLDAVGERASDIHLEIYSGRVRVRLRVDGDLHDVSYYHLSAEELRGLVNVIKLRADLDIAERRRPQGGRTRLRVGWSTYDLRVQTQPCLHGEHVIIRLLPQSSELLGIEDLGFAPELAATYRRALQNPAGLLLVVGPTGSGKSTTLYAGLQELAQDGRRKVITVEDPIEYSIDNIQQTAVRPELGFCFADAMRAFVREDPDVILVGEIRDPETAMEAIRASQTGHVVLSTLHSNSATEALQRIYDLGVHPNSLAGELIAVIAQQLAKRICPKCKQPAEPEAEILREVFPGRLPRDFRCFRGSGCEHCEGRGTRGRVGVIEFLLVNSAIRNAISTQPPVDELRRLALEAGMVTMRQSALQHVVQGNIPFSELPWILPRERLAPEQVDSETR